MTSTQQAATVHRAQVGVARIFEMPSGLRNHPAAKAVTTIRMPKKILRAGAELSEPGRRGASTKICDITMPAMMRLAIAPFPNGHTYSGTWSMRIQWAQQAEL